MIFMGGLKLRKKKEVESLFDDIKLALPSDMDLTYKEYYIASDGKLGTIVIKFDSDLIPDEVIEILQNNELRENSGQCDMKVEKYMINTNKPLAKIKFDYWG